jgi:heat shock protein HtpX
MVSFWDVQNKNKIYSYLLLSGMFFILLLIILGAYLILELDLIIVGILVFASLVYVFLVNQYSDSIILKMIGAKEADPKNDIYIINVTEGLALASGFKKPPKLYILEEDYPNAFALGKDPDNSAIVLTIGLIKIMDRAELEGVLAHEMSHLKNYDTRFMMIAVLTIGMISLLANVLLRVRITSGSSDKKDRGNILVLFYFLFLLLSPLFAYLLSYAISRKREFLADSTAAQLTRNPAGLASALEKIKNTTAQPKDYGSLNALFIAEPVKRSLTHLFSTHPPIEERIKILRSM